MALFDKILIANRGEIACRVIRSARSLGIATVAVYSEADRDSLHAALADEAVLIGPPPSAQSYLDIDKIVAACRDTGAQAVHPGYGFLSENAAFATRLQEEGITFIGPGVHAITSMGDKITSKKLAMEAGVSTIPGYTGVIRDGDHAVEAFGDLSERNANHCDALSSVVSQKFVDAFWRPMTVPRYTLRRATTRLRALPSTSSGQAG